MKNSNFLLFLPLAVLGFTTTTPTTTMTTTTPTTTATTTPEPTTATPCFPLPEPFESEVTANLDEITGKAGAALDDLSSYYEGIMGKEIMDRIITAVIALGDKSGEIEGLLEQEYKSELDTVKIREALGSALGNLVKVEDLVAGMEPKKDAKIIENAEQIPGILAKACNRLETVMNKLDEATC